jgi:hypothetical protein
MHGFGTILSLQALDGFGDRIINDSTNPRIKSIHF